MNCNALAKEIFEKLQLDLKNFPLDSENRLLMIESSFNLIDKALYQLKGLLHEYEFNGEDEEIEFFKVWMTKFLSHSIFYSELFLIESDNSISRRGGQAAFYLEKMNDLQKYIQRYASLNNYMVMEKSYLDRIYFLRKSEAPLIYPDLVHQTLDTRFCTVYTLYFARLKAMIHLMNHLSGVVHTVEKELEIKSVRNEPQPILHWTGSKVELVELIYALKTTSVLNRGSASVSDLAMVFGHLFGQEVKDCYRIFLQIKSRKKNRTVFLEACKERLEAYMDESDRNV
jgi:hypothetical protein